jgi:DNA ligase-1
MLYSELCEVYEKLEKTPKRLEKTEILSEFLKKLKKSEGEIVYLLQGKIFPDYDTREIGISTQLAIKALSKATGENEIDLVKKWKKTGDLGLVSEEVSKRKRQSTLFSKKLTPEKVMENLRKLTEFTGKGTVDKKIGLISELLTSASPTEAKYIMRMLLADLRIGIGSGVMRDAIVWACFDKEDKEKFIEVQEAYDKATDFAEVFELALKNKLDEITLSPGKPVKVMLVLKAKDVTEGFESVGKPAAIEYKYDGFRMMINKNEKGEIKIFTRRLEEVTNQFPEVKEYIKKFVTAKTFIIDSEAVGFNSKSKKYLPFQDISQRIKRKYDIDKVQQKLPIEINIFDIIYYNGKNMLNEPFEKRREILEKIIKQEKYKLKLAEQLVTDDEKKAQKFYERALKDGQEGVIMKSLQAGYKPGARVGFQVKIKPSSNELDLVIVKAEAGTGKRAGWLTSFTVACKDGENLLEIGKVSTGLKEKESEGTSFVEITKLLKHLIISEKGREVEVKPKIVITITYQEVQKSPSYSSGYALRFPRFTTLRIDRDVDDIATLKEIERDYATEQSRKWEFKR